MRVHADKVPPKSASPARSPASQAVPSASPLKPSPDLLALQSIIVQRKADPDAPKAADTGEEKLAADLRARNPDGMLVALCIPDAFDEPPKDAAAPKPYEDAEVKEALDSDSYPWNEKWTKYRKARIAAAKEQLAALGKKAGELDAGDPAGKKALADLKVQIAEAKKGLAGIEKLPDSYKADKGKHKEEIRDFMWKDVQERDVIYSVAYHNNHEFLKAAEEFAQKNRAVSTQDGALSLGTFMIYDKASQIPGLVQGTHAAAAALLARHRKPDDKAQAAADEKVAMIRSLAIFGHGEPFWVGGHGKAKSAGFKLGDVKGMVEGMSSVLTPDVHLALFACSAGRGVYEDPADLAKVKAKKTKAEAQAAKADKAAEKVPEIDKQIEAIEKSITALKVAAAATPAPAAPKKKGKKGPDQAALERDLAAKTASRQRLLDAARNAHAALDQAQKDVHLGETKGEWSMADRFRDALVEAKHEKASVLGHRVAGHTVANWQLRFYHGPQGEDDETAFIGEWRPDDIFDEDFIEAEIDRLVEKELPTLIPGAKQPTEEQLAGGVELYRGTVQTGKKGQEKKGNFMDGEFSDSLNYFVQREAFMQDLSSLESMRTSCQAAWIVSHYYTEKAKRAFLEKLLGLPPSKKSRKKGKKSKG